MYFLYLLSMGLQYTFVSSILKKVSKSFFENPFLFFNNLKKLYPKSKKAIIIALPAFKSPLNTFWCKRENSRCRSVLTIYLEKNPVRPNMTTPVPITAAANLYISMRNDSLRFNDSSFIANRIAANWESIFAKRRSM